MSFFRGIWKTSSLLVAAVAVTLALAAPVAAAPQIVVSGDRADAETIKSYFTGTSDADIDKGLEALRASGRGDLLFVTSVAGHEAYPGGSGYNAAKAGERPRVHYVSLVLLQEMRNKDIDAIDFTGAHKGVENGHSLCSLFTGSKQPVLGT